MIKVIHFADMHLDSPFSSLEQSRADEKREELLSCFTSSISLINDMGAHILLIAGDLFDTPFPSEDCAARAFAALESFEGEVFISAGNHDPIIEGSVWKKQPLPKNVHLFTDKDITCHTLLLQGCEVRVYGCSFTSFSYTENPLLSCPPLDGTKLNIFCCHGDLSSPESSYAPISKLSVTELAPHYLALGHIHKRSEIIYTSSTAYGYCGCMMGRDFGETGQKGCYLLEFDPSLPSPPKSHSFIPLAKRVFEEVEINLEKSCDSGEIISSLTPVLGDKCHLRLVLTGERERPCHQIMKDVAAGIEGRVASLEFADRSFDKPDYLALENDPSVTGEFYRLLKPSLQTDPIARQALKIGLDALAGRDVSKSIDKD